MSIRGFKSHPVRSAFTLIELLTVIGLIAVIVAIAAPAIGNFRKGNAVLAANRQMLDAVARARQLAISDHTTVYMVFVPPSFWDNSVYPNQAAFNALPVAEKDRAVNALDKQYTGYTYVSLHSIGDQPGQIDPRYLAPWQTLPEKSFIPAWKFTNSPPWMYVGRNPDTGLPFQVFTFGVTNIIPFPSEDAPVNNTGGQSFWLPYIAFNYLGQLTSGQDEYIPLAQGGVLYARNPLSKALKFAPASALENPAGNSTNTTYNLIHIDWITGRARLEHQEVQ